MSKFSINWNKSWDNKSKEFIREEIIRQLSAQNILDLKDDQIDFLVKDVISRKEMQDNNKYKSSIFKKLISLTLVTSLLVSPLIILEYGKQFISKNELRIKIINVIKNGGDVDDLKTAFNSILADSSSGFELVFEKSGVYEKKNISLLQVLEDIKSQTLISNFELNENQRYNLNRIREVINRYNKVNPFDSLDESTKRDFRSIEEKLDEVQYAKIKDEISNLTNSIKEKNRLIEKYLSSSNIGLLISAAAFLFSIVTSIWQLWLSREKNDKRIIQEVLENKKTSHKSL